MKRRIPLLNIAILLLGFLVLMLSGCARYMPVDSGTLPYWDGEDATYINVTENLSAYGIRGKDYSNISYSVTRFFLDLDEKTEVVGNGNYNTWKLKVPIGTTDIYVHPLHITTLSEIEEQQILLDQEFPIQTDYFSVISISIPNLTDNNIYDERIRLAINLVSEVNQYPENLTLLYDEKSYSFSSFSAEVDDDGYVAYLHLKCEMPDLYTASMAMKYGTLKYSKLQTIVPGDKAVYTCDDESITLHIIEIE